MDDKLPDVQARQGFKGRPVLGVLTISLSLGAIAILGYLIWVFASSPDATTGSVGEPPSPAQDAPLISPANPSNPAPATNPSAQ